MSIAAEQALVARARGGDESAFDEIVVAHRERVFALACLSLRDRHAAAEVAHEAFVRLFRSLPAFRGEARLATWLHRVTLNLCHDMLRERRRQVTRVSIDELDGLAAPDDRVHPETMALARASDESVRRAIAKLPPPLREVIALRFGAELSYAEIASALHWPLGTVCTRLQRAMKLLEQELASS
ncbi:MAG TPA: sigma-70 family RNA polymerase sigma factor [Vicinamibacterales bacterium]|nr:sigma-70 family RNA polymerase sigma factor [Vicinamibacterales bacterium]